MGLNTITHRRRSPNVESTPGATRPGPFVPTMCPVELGWPLYGTVSRRGQRRSRHTIHRQLVPASKSYLPGLGYLLRAKLGLALATAVNLPEPVTEAQN